MTRTLTAPAAILKPLGHSGLSVTQFYTLHFLGALFPLTGALILYGWRAVWAVGLVVGSAAVAIVVWRRVGAMGRQLRFSHGLWLALLLSLMLPAHLATTAPDQQGDAPWPLLPAAGVLLVILLWALGGLGAGRVHPVLITYLLFTVLFGDKLVPTRVLQPDRVVLGDLLDALPPDPRGAAHEPWIKRRRGADNSDATSALPATDQLINYTRGTQAPDRGLLRLQAMLRDRLPPLEDLVVGGQPGALGVSSAIAVIIGGLFLLYRGVIDYRVPLLTIAATFFSLLVMPVPARITDRPQWRWLVVREADVDWATAVTFVNYELMASPVLFTAFFLATAPSVRPMARRARVLYAMLAGVLTAGFQLYWSVAYGPYVALLAVSLLTPSLDKWFHPRPLV